MYRLAKRYVCKECGAEYLVTKEGKCDIYCCGAVMTEKDGAEIPLSGKARKTLEGKRYDCKSCGVELLCIRQGASVPQCCGQEMSRQDLMIKAISE